MRLAAALGCVALAAVLWWRHAHPPFRAGPGEVVVSFLDVGQGDATLVQDGDGTSVLFDGGPPEAAVHRALRAAGVRRLDLVVATHQSRDHQGGLHAVLARIPTRLLLENGDGTADPDFRRLLAEADARGIRRVTARAGQVLRGGLADGAPAGARHRGRRARRRPRTPTRAAWPRSSAPGASTCGCPRTPRARRSCRCRCARSRR